MPDKRAGRQTLTPEARAELERQAEALRARIRFEKQLEAKNKASDEAYRRITGKR